MLLQVLQQKIFKDLQSNLEGFLIFNPHLNRSFVLSSSAPLTPG